jgi:hypothetical protein
MLVPTHERTLNAYKTCLERVTDQSFEFFRLRSQLDPFIVDVWNYLSVLLHELFVHVGYCITSIAFVLHNFCFFLDVSDQVKVLNLARTSWWQYEVVDWLLFYFFRVNFDSIVKHHTNVKQWHKASRGLVGLRARVVEVHL